LGWRIIRADPSRVNLTALAANRAAKLCLAGHPPTRSLAT